MIELHACRPSAGRPRTLHGAALIAALAAAALVAGCGSRSKPTEPRVATAVRLSLAANPIEVHEETAASAVTLDQFGSPIAAGPAAYASSSEAVAVVNPTDGRIFAFAQGTTRIRVTIDGRSDEVALTVNKPPIRINEVKPDGAGSTGWVELLNTSPVAVDLSGYTLTASDVFQEFSLPAGTTIPANGYLVVEESSFPSGLGAVDAVHLFSRFGVQVEQFGWPGDAATSYARCPDGTGTFTVSAAPTPGAANACP